MDEALLSALIGYSLFAVMIGLVCIRLFSGREDFGRAAGYVVGFLLTFVLVSIPQLVLFWFLFNQVFWWGFLYIWLLVTQNILVAIVVFLIGLVGLQIALPYLVMRWVVARLIFVRFVFWLPTILKIFVVFFLGQLFWRNVLAHGATKATPGSFLWTFWIVSGSFFAWWFPTFMCWFQLVDREQQGEMPRWVGAARDTARYAFWRAFISTVLKIGSWAFELIEQPKLNVAFGEAREASDDDLRKAGFL